MKSDSFKFRCPGCKKSISTSRSNRGSNGVCPACGTPLVVPKSFGTLGRTPLVISLVTVAVLFIAGAAAFLLHGLAGSSDRNAQSHTVPKATEALPVSDNSTVQTPKTEMSQSSALIGTWEQDATVETRNNGGAPVVLIHVTHGFIRQGFYQREGPPPAGDLVRDLTPISVVITDNTLKLRLSKNDDLKGAFNVETGSAYVLEKEGEHEYLSDSYTFSAKPDGSLSKIELTKKDTDGKEIHYLGIAALDAGSLRICWALPGKERPTKFPDETCLNIVMKRSQSTPETAPKEHANVVGTEGNNKGGDRIEWADGQIWTNVTVKKLSTESRNGKNVYVLDLVNVPKGQKEGAIDRPFKAIRLRGSEPVTEKPVNEISYQKARDQQTKPLVDNLNEIKATDAWGDAYCGPWLAEWNTRQFQPENSMKAREKDGSLTYIQANVTIPLVVVEGSSLYVLVRNTGQNIGVVDAWLTGIGEIYFSHEERVKAK